MNETGALSVGVGAQRGKDRRDARADIAAQNEEQHVVRLAADGQTRADHNDDQRGDDRAGLYDRRKYDADQQQQKGIVNAG